MPQYRPPFPTLIDPPGSIEDHGNGPCMASMGGNPIGLGITMRSSMSPQDLLDYYGRQLADSGWTPTPATVPGALKTWSRTDSIGTTSEVTVTVAPSSGTAACHMVYMQVQSSRKP